MGLSLQPEHAAAPDAGRGDVPGRAGVGDPSVCAAPKLAGNWQATLPAGFVQPTKVQELGEGHYLVRSQASIFNGKYQWRKGQLVVVEPADDRMIGLVWKWDGTKLTLVEEPKNHPTGASYVGTVLTTAPTTIAPTTTAPTKSAP